MVTPGGEVAFVERMIMESVKLRGRVRWYTSMLGKYSSLATIIERLKQVHVQNWAVKEFVQGAKTRRWAVAWSWGDARPRMVFLLPSSLSSLHLNIRQTLFFSYMLGMCRRLH